MMVRLRRWFFSRWATPCLTLTASLAMGSLIGGCGKDSSDPQAVTLDDLKFAFGLRIQDRGNGSVRLWWSGMNNEKDFSGYNIYGVKGDASIAALEGTSIQLLDDKGETIAAAKTTLAKMAYNGKDWETVGTEKKEDNAIAYYPYYKDKTVLPSCYPQAIRRNAKLAKQQPAYPSMA